MCVFAHETNRVNKCFAFLAEIIAVHFLTALLQCSVGLPFCRSTWAGQKNNLAEHFLIALLQCIVSLPFCKALLH